MIMKKLKQLIITSMLAIGLFAPALAAGTVSAQIPEESINSACQGIGAGGTDPCNGTAASGVDRIITTIVDILSWVVGILSVVMVLLAGLNFITANGDSSKIQKARSSLIYALIGVAITVSAQLLVNFVVGKVNTTVTTDSSGNYIITCQDGRSITVGSTVTQEQAEALCG